MSELAHVEGSSLEVLPPQRPTSLPARQMLMAHAEMMQTAHQLAVAMCGTQMVPVRFRGKPDDGAAAILYGAELGLNPIQSLQRIIPIHGMPSLEARTMVALLKSKGYRVRTTAVSDESVTVTGVDLDGEAYESTWTIERARRAGYVPEVDEKTGKYKTNDNGKLKGNEKFLTDPVAMLKAKAQAEVCRDMAPDVLLGISYTSEELESERFDDSALPKPLGKPRGVGAAITVDEILEDGADDVQPEQPVQQAEPEPVDEAADAEPESSPADDFEPPAEPQPAEPASEPAKKAPAKKAPAKKAAPEKPQDQAQDKPEKTQMRRALEKRLFTLIRDIEPPLDRDDRLIIYRFITARPDITSTDDLSDVEVGAVCDQLYAWSQKNELNERATDALNTATLAEVEAENTTTEGK